MTVNVMAIMASVSAIMLYAAYLDGNPWGVGAMASLTFACGYLAWENRMVVKK